MAEERFDLVVFRVTARRRRQNWQALGIELNPFGFCATDNSPAFHLTSGLRVWGVRFPKEMSETLLDPGAAAGDAHRATVWVRCL
jgi:hypothetical protein